MAIAGCNYTSQNPKHARKETKRINMGWNIGSTVQFSKAQLNENQCEWTHVVCSDACWMFHHCQLAFVIDTAKKSMPLSLSLSLNAIICSLSHESPKYPLHLYSFCSFCRLWISKWRFHSWHVGGVLACPNRRLRGWKSGCSRGPKKTCSINQPMEFRGQSSWDTPMLWFQNSGLQILAFLVTSIRPEMERVLWVKDPSVAKTSWSSTLLSQIISKPLPFQSIKCQLKMFIIVIQTMMEQIW